MLGGDPRRSASAHLPAVFLGWSRRADYRLQPVRGKIEDDVRASN